MATTSTYRSLVLYALCAAIMFVAQIALAPLPNIELVSLLVIIYTGAFKKKTLFIIYTFVLLQGLVYGFGIWWVTYMYVWTILFLIVYLLKTTNPIVLAVIAGIFGILFGTLTSIPYFITGGPGGGISYIIAGITFDFAHCVGNFFSVLLLYKPLSNALNKFLSVSSLGG